MYFKKFTNAAGAEVSVNLDRVDYAVAYNETEVLLHIGSKVITVRGTLDDLTAERPKANAEIANLATAITRNTQSIERLSVRIPSSIKMHM